jgi:hypothetical protein
MLLIAFSFGAFFEGAAGFGTPVAVTAAINSEDAMGFVSENGIPMAPVRARFETRK